MGFKQKIKSVFRFVGTLIVIISVVFIVRKWVVESYNVSTSSMETALYEGDYILVNKLLDLFPPKQNDVMLFTSPLLQDTVYNPLFLSRCIGMPGDTVRITSEGYYINGQAFPRSPRALNTYFVALSIKDYFLQQAKQMKIPVRDLKNEAFGITISLTTFEEYKLREEFTEEINTRFVCRKIDPYELVIPQKDRAYRLSEYNITACREAILQETNGAAEFRDGKLYLDGRETSFFFFHQNYYWFLSDNINEAIDSRHLGMIPENHLIGKAFFCWLSKDKQQMMKRIK